MNDHAFHISNEEKRQVYAILKAKLKVAIEQEFYLEALLIEYAIAEDRLNSILHHMNIRYIDSKGEEISISRKIGKVRNLIENQPLVAKRLSTEQLDSLIQWKDIRNSLVHHSCQRLYKSEEVQECAIVGAEVIRMLSNSSQKIKRAVEKQAK